MPDKEMALVRDAVRRVEAAVLEGRPTVTLFAGGADELVRAYKAADDACQHYAADVAALTAERDQLREDLGQVSASLRRALEGGGA